MKKNNPQLHGSSSNGLGEPSSQKDCDETTEYIYPEQTLPIIESAVANDFDQYRQKYLGFFRLGNDRTYIVNFEGES